MNSKHKLVVANAVFWAWTSDDHLPLPKGMREKLAEAGRQVAATTAGELINELDADGSLFRALYGSPTIREEGRLIRVVDPEWIDG